MRSHWEHYDKFLVDKGFLTNEEIYNRNMFRLNEWLAKIENINRESKEYLAMQLVVYQQMIKDTLSDDVYGRMTPTKFARKTLMNTMYIDDSKIKKVIILTRNVSESQAESKRRFVEKLFNHPKIEMIEISRDENKGEALLSRGIDWKLMVDDEIPNIHDITIAYKGNMSGREFLIPEYGYNKMPEYLELLIAGQGAAFTYYETK